ncbi:tetratricopeptide repeat protein [Devosia sp. ZB163]|uniref:tetratricopeptide repeat protein n=1 Tax=Devosia sp. ZB163 TaxID=3025938 RepID=UPI0023616A63|nr:tetratricopeptide repeat protein [Devosia sp. ZB163]MDC9824887.1 tetratricopeptide repeat protein [Devosia sp. ZB163]
MRKPDTTFGIVGGLSAFPRRLAARALASKGGRLRRGITRHTASVVLGRTMLDKLSDAEIEARVEKLRESGTTLMSENGFLRALGLMSAPEQSNLTRQSLLDQSRLDRHAFDMLVLFDAFEHDVEPFSFRDLILSRKYAGLVAGGATWGAIARSVHRSGPVQSLTAKSLHPGGPSRIHALEGDQRTELDGQRLLPLQPIEDESEEYFSLAEAAEGAGLFAEAAVLYGHCLAIDPNDSVAAFNRANCLKATHDNSEAAVAYMLAIKRDPEFVEAWFNYAGLLREEGKIQTAREHLARAIEIDPDYADAVYNLATLEYDAGRLAEARRWWARYLELDQNTEWARTAARGIAYADSQLRKSAG